MNLVSGNITASQRDILGLPVCDLGWAEAFAFAEEVATMPFGQSVIAFIPNTVPYWSARSCCPTATASISPPWCSTAASSRRT
jgi:hypothetical protein